MTAQRQFAAATWQPQHMATMGLYSLDAGTACGVPAWWESLDLQQEPRSPAGARSDPGTICRSRALGRTTRPASMDSTLIQAWASHKSFRPKDDGPGDIGRNQQRDFYGERHKNDTHASTTDPDARGKSCFEWCFSTACWSWPTYEDRDEDGPWPHL